MTKRSHPMAVAVAVGSARRRSDTRRKVAQARKTAAEVAEILPFIKVAQQRDMDAMRQYRLDRAAWDRLPFWKKDSVPMPQMPVPTSFVRFG